MQSAYEFRLGKDNTPVLSQLRKLPRRRRTVVLAAPFQGVYLGTLMRAKDQQILTIQYNSRP